MTLGNRIKELRTSKMMTQKELAEIVDVSRSDNEMTKLIEIYNQLNENNRILALARMIELLKEQ